MHWQFAVVHRGLLGLGRRKMNTPGLENARAGARATAARALMLWSASMIASVLPPLGDTLRSASEESLRRKLSDQRSEFLALTFPEMHPVESDLWAQEALEAFDLLAAEFLARVFRS